MAKTERDENEIIAEMQADFARLKANARKLMVIQKQAGRHKGYHLAYKSKVAIESAHVVCGDCLIEAFDNGAEVSAMGPGR